MNCEVRHSLLEHAVLGRVCVQETPRCPVNPRDSAPDIRFPSVPPFCTQTAHTLGLEKSQHIRMTDRMVVFTLWAGPSVWIPAVGPCSGLRLANWYMGCIPASRIIRIKKGCEESVALILLPCSTTGSSKQVLLEYVNFGQAKNNCVYFSYQEKIRGRIIRNVIEKWQKICGRFLPEFYW